MKKIGKERKTLKGNWWYRDYYENQKEEHSYKNKRKVNTSYQSGVKTQLSTK